MAAKIPILDLYISKTPKFIRYLFSSAYWKLHPERKTVYLTFDDGPTPEVTPWVMGQLEEFNAKGTFFCLGNNVEQHPDIFKELQDRGHAIGNHSYDHPAGWKTPNVDYYDNIARAAKVIDSNIFRPPYGKISLSQYRHLRKLYQIVMWDVVSFDYVTTLTGEECIERVLSNVENGSIIVFHDSHKAWPRLSYALPKVIENLKKQGYRFDIIEVKD